MAVVFTMRFPPLHQCAAVLLWAATGVAATGFVLAWPSVRPVVVPLVQDVQAASAPVEAVAQLLGRKAAAADMGEAGDGDASSAGGALQLLGIAHHADDSRRSHAVLLLPPHAPRAFAVGEVLPNGAQVLAIDSRAVQYRLDGVRHTLALPAP